jgi:RNA exonuclease 4
VPARRAGDARTGGHRLKPKALRVLAKEVLGETIQEGEHSPAIDARVALHIYRVHAAAWERSLKATQAARKRHGRPVQQAASDGQR